MTNGFDPAMPAAWRNGPASSNWLRAHLQLTQQEFALLLGLSPVSISRWERGHMTPLDHSRMMLDLLKRALLRNPADKVLQTLRPLVMGSDLERVVALVHLGDDPGPGTPAPCA